MKFLKTVAGAAVSSLWEKVSGNVVLKDTDGDIIDIDIPMTLNANGAWYKKGLKEKFDGVEYKDKEDMLLAWAERRPKKSKEITTSVNTYMRLASAGVV